jgi:hypothetical protein
MTSLSEQQRIHIVLEAIRQQSELQQSEVKRIVTGLYQFGAYRNLRYSSYKSVSQLLITLYQTAIIHSNDEFIKKYTYESIHSSNVLPDVLQHIVLEYLSDPLLLYGGGMCHVSWINSKVQLSPMPHAGRTGNVGQFYSCVEFRGNVSQIIWDNMADSPIFSIHDNHFLHHNGHVLINSTTVDRKLCIELSVGHLYRALQSREE